MTLPATLHALWYSDAGIADRERHAIFGREWLFVGWRSQLREPGDYLATDIAGWNLVIVVNDDGRLVAHHNVCRHRAGPLVDPGTGRVNSFVCRYHGWAYGLGGELRAARDFGSDDCDGLALWPLRVETWRGLVFVNLDNDALPLADALGTFVDACVGFDIEAFTPTIERTHELACNWKTYADNYLEGYHVPLVHPGLNKEIDAKRYRVDVDEEFRWIESSAPQRDGAVNLGRWLWRWPNFALNLYPDAINIERFEPVDPRRSRLRYSYAFRDASAAANEEVLRVSNEVTAEDIAVCESVQRNLESGVYTQGSLSPRHENGIAAFQRWVFDSLA